MGHSRPLFILLFSFVEINVLYKKILMTAWTFVSGSSGIEATALPTAPRPLPYSKGVMRLICTEIIKRNTKKNV